MSEERKNISMGTARKRISNLGQKIINQDREKLKKEFKYHDTILKIFDAFCENPMQNVASLVKKTGISRQNITKAINKLIGMKKTIISPLDPNKKGAHKYIYRTKPMLMEDVKNNSTKTQNSEGVFLEFNGRDIAEKLLKTPVTKEFQVDNSHNTKTNDTKNRLYIEDNVLVAKKLLKEGIKFDLIYLDVLYDAPATRSTQPYLDSSQFEGECDFLKEQYPILHLSRQLLKPDGLIAVSISCHHLASLKMLMDEIYGPEQCLSIVTVITSETAGPVSGYTSYRLPNTTSFLLLYCFDHTKVNNLQRLYESSSKKYTEGFNVFLEQVTPGKPVYKKTPLIDYLKKQPKIVKLFQKHNLDVKATNISNLADIDVEFQEYLHNDLAKNLFKATAPRSNPLPSDLNAPTDKVFEYDGKLFEKTRNGVVYHFKRFFDKLIVNEDGTIENGHILGNVFDLRSERVRIQKEGGVTFYGGKKPQKLTDLLIRLINNRKSAVIGDFFAGSGTTAASVIQANQADGSEGKRTWILAQRHEKVIEKSEEAKEGFKYIEEITIKRLENAIKKTNGTAGFLIYR